MPLDLEALRAHFGRLASLLEVERLAEKAERARELENLSPATREALGRTVTRLSVDGAEDGVGSYARLVLSRAPRGETLVPFHAMSQGDNVRVTFPPGTEPASIDGTLDKVEEYRASVSVAGRLPDPLPEGRCTIDHLGSDATYKRMRQALERAQKLAAGGPAARLRDCLVGLETPEAGTAQDLEFFDTDLNEYQRAAVRRALAADPLSLVHGPPGTGKTTVLAEVVRQAAARGWRVLATAPSNVAVDNMLEKVLVAGLRVVRLGHPARTLESLRHATLSAQVAEDGQFSSVQEMDAWRERLHKRLARRGSRPMDYSERDGMRREADRLWREARKAEEAIGRRLVLSAQVVLSTHGGLSSNHLKGEFDLVVLDEASQAPEPLSWVALTRGARAVFAGDARQLPPTLYAKDAAEGGLAVTLLERLEKTLPEDLQTLLRVQYRMHETIMGFSSKEFYGGKLVADESVKAHLACELPGAASDDLTGVPLVYVDTAGTGWEEGLDELLQSRFNEGEAELAVKLARRLLDAGLDPKQVAILTPYTAQSRLIKSKLRVPGLEIGSVDGFQGREKEATVLSLVRSNERGEVGFLSDTRRMNVATTRARRLSIVIGDSVTISQHPFYRAFLAYAEAHGSYRSAYEF
ncbi:MAG: AAA family ATPase [Elusimicrobia bacterium]|nr:AAA family ATPase [Elusimicrobiota bacterium]